MGLWPWKKETSQDPPDRLRFYANQRKDYLLYIAAPPGNPTQWVRIRHLADETAVLEDGSTVRLSALSSFLVAYPNGQILDVDGARGLPLPAGIRGLEGQALKREDVLRLEDLKSGDTFVKVHFGRSTSKRPGYYSTTLTNVGPEPIRVLKFGGYSKRRGIWKLSTTTGDYFSDKEFCAWYGRERVWLNPGECAVDQNNYGDPPVVWAYFGQSKSGVTFIAGAVLGRPL